MRFFPREREKSIAHTCNSLDTCPQVCASRRSNQSRLSSPKNDVPNAYNAPEVIFQMIFMAFILVFR